LAFGSIKFRVHLGPDPEPERSEETQVLSGVADMLDSESFGDDSEGSSSDVRFLLDDEVEN
jgi:hypothetical protein